jgi:hypothetical protein
MVGTMDVDVTPSANIVKTVWGSQRGTMRNEAPRARAPSPNVNGAP